MLYSNAPLADLSSDHYTSAKNALVAKIVLKKYHFRLPPKTTSIKISLKPCFSTSNNTQFDQILHNSNGCYFQIDSTLNQFFSKGAYFKMGVFSNYLPIL